MLIPFENICNWHAYYSLPVDVPASSACLNPPEAQETRRRPVGEIAGLQQLRINRTKELWRLERLGDVYPNPVVIPPRGPNALDISLRKQMPTPPDSSREWADLSNVQ